MGLILFQMKALVINIPHWEEGLEIIYSQQKLNYELFNAVILHVKRNL